MSDFLVKEDELHEILYRSLFYSPIINKYWITHQLLEVSCSLRVTKKDKRFPEVIGYLR
ncbi:primase 1D-like protein [Arachidicoccus ginsenosidivorans]